MSVTKAFDKELLTENDTIAKILCKYIATVKGYNAIENPDTYGVDILATKNGITLGIEGEIKKGWIGEFTFDTLHITHRKKRLLETEQNVFFIVISQDYKNAYIVSGDVVGKSEVIEVKNKFVADGEMFFNVPISKCQLFKLL